MGDPLNYGTQPDVYGVDGCHIEVKRTEQIRLADWMKQAERDAEKFRDGMPVIFHRKSRSKWVAIMSLESWAVLYKGYQKL